MQSIEIDPELNRLALAEAAQQYPEFAEHALRVVARPAFARIRLATRVEGSATAWARSVGVSKHCDPGVQDTGENHGLVQDQWATRGERHQVWIGQCWSAKYIEPRQTLPQY